MKKGFIIIAIIILLTPIGILLTWNNGDAWGEWGEVKIKNKTWTPKEYSGGAPLPDYSIPTFDEENKFLASVAYWISAIVGVAMCFFVMLGIAKAIELW